MNNRDMSILTINVKTKTAENTMDLAEDLKIDPMNINENFCSQPALYAYWATIAAQAKALVDKKKAELDRADDYLKKTLVGELDAEVRQQMEVDGEKITEGKVTNAIYKHTRYVEQQEKIYALRDELLNLQQQWTVLDIAKESMNQRKDMLISLGANLRQETTNTELALKAKNVANMIKNQ